MDQLTHEIRMANWQQIIKSCQARPEGQSARQWLAENNIPDKQYYYWLRKIRKKAFDESPQSLPAVSPKQSPAVSFVEIPAEEVIGSAEVSKPAITIWTKRSTIEIPTDLPESLIVKLVKAGSHAL